VLFTTKTFFKYPDLKHKLSFSTSTVFAWFLISDLLWDASPNKVVLNFVLWETDWSRMSRSPLDSYFLATDKAVGLTKCLALLLKFNGFKEFNWMEVLFKLVLFWIIVGLALPILVGLIGENIFPLALSAKEPWCLNARWSFLPLMSSGEKDFLSLF